jgi:flagellar biosynthetic protein FliP
MAPTFDRAWQNGLQPLMKNEITEQEAYSRVTDPFRDFMLQHVREKDLQTFENLAAESMKIKLEGQRIDLRIIIPAFMVSELRRAFEIGFLVVMPFLVIDMIVATLTMSMGMMMMPPTVFALPFKVLFFVLIDGWNLLAVGLVKSFL